MKTFEKAAVIGAGAWGTSLSIILSKNLKNVSVWAREPEVVASVNERRCNERFLPDIKIPQNVAFTGNAAEALKDADIVVWGVPIQFLSRVAEEFSPHIKEGSIHINAGKGIEIGTWKRPSQILREKLSMGHSFGSIMGPNIAFEVARGSYAEAVIALNDFSDAKDAAAIFSTATFNVRPSNDVVGVEIGAALKNIVALAAGFCDGMKLGANTKAIIMARGFQEIYRAAAALGAWSESFIKESAILGDVLTTCMSPDSRNRSTGERMGMGYSAAEAVKMLNGRVCAGLETIQICKMFESVYGVDLRIMGSLCLLSEGKISREDCLKRMLGA
ncbi:MAG: NAD(P)H-dependent glycerol-3-phosphate dehydrogenase [Opitutales bacterium]|nr:NAD(P)H-dependent glycerol-3-phosphate dehydrogenase [Opitutales bacterium]